MSELDYATFWKTFILSLVGNWLLKYNSVGRNVNMRHLDQLLRGMDLRSESDSAQPIFQRILNQLTRLTHWKSAEIEVETSPEGAFSFTPKVEFKDQAQPIETKSIRIEDALRLLDTCLFELKKVAWVAIDRLDEAFQGYPDVEIPALRALFRTYLDLTAYESIRLKPFVRRDLFRRIVGEQFVNLTHVNAQKIEVIWDEDDLLSLLCRRVRQNKNFCEKVGLLSLSDRELSGRLFPDQVDQGARRPQTWVWMMSRIRDGNDIKPPRNLIDLVSFARDAQLRREDREPRQFDPKQPIIEAESLRRALAQLSETRVSDTLLAEAKNQAPQVEKFRRGKAEHNEESLSYTLNVPLSQVRATVKPLLELGLLEEIGGSYKVPMLYRGGLEITQGKAFDLDEA